MEGSQGNDNGNEKSNETFIERGCPLAGKCAGCCCIKIPGDDIGSLVKNFRHRKLAFDKYLYPYGNIARYNDYVGRREKIVHVKMMGEQENLVKRCHFLGFIDNHEKNIGCLAHPEMNGGRDFRDQGFYLSARYCGSFLCGIARSYSNLNYQERKEFSRRTSGWSWQEFNNESMISDALKRSEMPKMTIGDLQRRYSEGKK